jgi:hypothetical protein
MNNIHKKNNNLRGNKYQKDQLGNMLRKKTKKTCMIEKSRIQKNLLMCVFEKVHPKKTCVQ